MTRGISLRSIVQQRPEGCFLYLITETGPHAALHKVGIASGRKNFLARLRWLWGANGRPLQLNTYYEVQSLFAAKCLEEAGRDLTAARRCRGTRRREWLCGPVADTLAVLEEVCAPYPRDGAPWPSRSRRRAALP